MTVEELYHTADILIRVRASDIPTLFAEAVRGMSTVMDGGCEGGEMVEEIDLRADDLEELLQDFLSELLFLSDVRGMVFCSSRVTVEGTTLHATLRGVPFDRTRHQGTEIKGVSYYGLQIVKEGESYVTDILFDV